jgi:hypothetical protein
MEILARILAAFAGVRGDLTESEVDAGMAIIRDEYDCDLKAVERDLCADLSAHLSQMPARGSLSRRPRSGGLRGKKG